MSVCFRGERHQSRVDCRITDRWAALSAVSRSSVDHTTARAGGHRRGDGTWWSPTRSARRGRLADLGIAAGQQSVPSALLRCDLPVDRLSQISLLAGVAVCETVREWCPADIKWPNDVLAGGRKVAGILAELDGGGARRAVILGIGVNLNTALDAFPPELRDKAGSLRLALQGGRPALFTAACSHLEVRYDKAPRRLRADRAAWRAGAADRSTHSLQRREPS